MSDMEIPFAQEFYSDSESENQLSTYDIKVIVDRHEMKLERRLSFDMRILRHIVCICICLCLRLRADLRCRLQAAGFFVCIYFQVIPTEATP